MKAFLDTNVLLDILMESRSGHEAALFLLQVIRSGDIAGCLTTQSVIDAAYVQTQRLKSPSKSFKKAIHTLSGFVETLAIGREDIREACKSPVEDFEDAAQLACAIRSGCDVIVTSDKKYQAYTDISCFTPQQLVSLLLTSEPVPDDR